MCMGKGNSALHGSVGTKPFKEAVRQPQRSASRRGDGDGLSGCHGQTEGRCMAPHPTEMGMLARD